MFSRTSTGMSVLPARLESGSPGANASTEYTTRLMKSSVGIAIRMRRSAYVATLFSSFFPPATVDRRRRSARGPTRAIRVKLDYHQSFVHASIGRDGAGRQQQTEQEACRPVCAGGCTGPV